MVIPIPPAPGPPPPPPGPPPPPIGGFKLNAGGGGAPDMRGALLQSIQKGAKLKKTVTVDKSGPALGGAKVSSSSSASATSSSGGASSLLVNGGSGVCGGVGGGAKLGGIFGEMSSMPKLKPIGNRGGGNGGSGSQSTINRSPPTETSTQSNGGGGSGGSGGGSGIAIDFNTELTNRLTLKKQKHSSKQLTTSAGNSPAGSGNATEANLRTNRGPPPQPPCQLAKQNISSSTSDSILGKNRLSPTGNAPVSASTPVLAPSNNASPVAGYKKNGLNGSTRTTNNSVGSPSSGAPSVFSLAPNKSSLFNTATTSAPSPSPPPPMTSTTMTTTTSSGLFSGSAAGSAHSYNQNNSSNLNNNCKPMPNYGKPNLAPKPPGTQLLTIQTQQQQQSVASTLGNGQTGRPTVARHHSMKTPRSPPVAPPQSGAPVYPSANHFGTMRGPPQLFQSQESIVRQAPGAPIGRPTVAPPPRPPANRPPPPPSRSVSNTNLTSMPLSTPPGGGTLNINSCLEPPATAASTFGSVNNVSSAKEQQQQQQQQQQSQPYAKNQANSTTNLSSPNAGAHQSRLNGSGGSISSGPPLPPHRTCPAPPPPVLLQRQLSNTPASGAPPVPPTRHSSIRAPNSCGQTQSTMANNSPTGPLNFLTLTGAGHNTTMTTGTSTSATSSAAALTQSSPVGSVNRLVTDLETKFSQKFRKVNDFPKPPPFLNVTKSYPSRNTVKTVNAENRKKRAPNPPGIHATAHAEQDCDSALASSGSGGVDAQPRPPLSPLHNNPKSHNSGKSPD